MLYIFIASAIIFYLAYRYYGNFLNRKFQINDSNTTPACTMNDGKDYLPTRSSVLFGHHFSSIAGAGPIVGPIIAGIAFGWLPALLWIVLGSIFIGGVHDYSSLVASIRHKARSIGELAKNYMSKPAYKLFLLFIWLALVYILVVFVDLTATSYVESPAVASSSGMFILLALILGVLLKFTNLSLNKTSLIFVPLVFLCIFLGRMLPLDLSGMFSNLQMIWVILLLVYCFLASTSPVWLLLQPRDYLSSFLLLGSLLVAFIGLLLGGLEMSYPAFTSWSDIERGTLFPILFITIACGACSGFHSIVSSGTTSKQLARETDARRVGYGAMLVEGLLAVIALFTVVMLSQGSSLLNENPLMVFGNGIGRFIEALGLPYDLGRTFGILAVSTFLLTTLDTASRLGRYIFEELFSFTFKGSKYISTAITLLFPFLSVFITLHDVVGNPIPAWKAVWPIFGVTNQLMAGFALLVIYIWMRNKGKNYMFLLLPMFFMLIMTVWALGQLIYQSGFTLLGYIAIFLLALTIWLIVESIKSIKNLADKVKNDKEKEKVTAYAEN